MAWFLVHREGVSLMEGDYEVEFSSFGGKFDLKEMIKDAGTMVFNLSKDRPQPKPKPAPAKEAHPRGVWIWELAKLPRDYMQQLIRAGVGRVYLKVFDDASAGNGFWSWQCTEANIKAFNEAGIEVWGWGYHFDRRTKIDPKFQADTLRVAPGRGIAGYVVDVEQEIKDKATHENLEELLYELRKVFPGKLGYTSFGAPQFHPEIPWSLLDEYCDLALPQIYFEKFTFGKDWRTEVEQCLAAHKDKGLTKPILPIWGSESDTKVPATVSELQAALDAFPGSSVWRVPNAGERGEALNLNYRGLLSSPPAPAPTPDPVGKSIRERVAALAKARCSQGRKHAPGNVIDREVLDPFRPILVQLGHLGASQQDTFFDWCACNVAKIYRDCGVPVPDRPIVKGKPFWASMALVEAWKALALDSGAWKARANGEAGDAIVFDWDANGTADHIGIILEVRGDEYLCAEGNKGNKEVIMYRNKLSAGGIIDLVKLAGVL